MLKIAFLLPVNGLAGGLFTVYEHAKRFQGRGHDVTLVFEQDWLGIVPKTYPGLEKVKFLHLKDAPPNMIWDVAIATFWETVYSLEKVPARRYGYFVQGFEERFYEAPERAMATFVEKTLRQPLGYFTVSQAIANFLKSKYGQTAEVIPNSIPFERFRDVKPAFEKPRDGKPRILVEGPGNLALKRISSAFQVLADFPELEVFYVSSDDYRKPEWKMDRYFAAVPYAEMPAIFASCDVLLKLSAEESFALPVLEMFASGGTAVVTAFEGHDEWLKDGENSLIVPIDDRSAAVAALRRLRDDRALLERLRAGARETCGRFDWARSNALFEKGLEELIATTGGLGPDHYRSVFADLAASKPGLVDLKSYTGTISHQKAVIEQRDHKIMHLEGLIREKDMLLHHKEQLILGKENVVHDLARQLGEKSARIDDLARQLGEKSAQVNDLTHTVILRDRDIHALQASPAWRLGRLILWPIRALKNLVSRAKLA